MKPNLVLKIGQHLTLTPQLQQAIKLLQMSTLDLQLEVQQAIESNPMLELEDEITAADDLCDNLADLSTPEIPCDDPTNNDSLLQDNWSEQIPTELSVDANWEEIYTNIPNNTQKENIADFSEKDTAAITLNEHLISQLNLISLPDNQHLAALIIIDSINPAGYLTMCCDEVTQLVCQTIAISQQEVETALKTVQNLEPPGIAARSLQECLLIQLELLKEKAAPELAKLELAIRLVNDHINLLSKRDINLLQKKLDVDIEQIKASVHLIQQLNPRPGNEIGVEAVAYIVPDVLVRLGEYGLMVELNPQTLPKLRINSYYQQLVAQKGNSSDINYIRQNLLDANWFIKSLQNRHETLLTVANHIVDCQYDFFEFGDEKMKPMTLKYIAERTGFHESTISRATAQKYMHTPRGIFELKYFFSSRLHTVAGDDCSSTAIRSMIKKILSSENPQKPHSDQKIASLLNDQGINVARRTIAKYRESMSIPRSNDRRRFAS